jgi:hypothetical protein
MAPNGAFATGGALSRGAGVASGRTALGMVGPGAIGPGGAVAPGGRINHWNGAGWKGRGHHLHARHQRFGLGFGWDYGNDTYCRRWTPTGYVWVCRYPYY